MTIEEFIQEYGPIGEFHRKHPGDSVIWVKPAKVRRGRFLFTFDKENIYNLFSDFPDKLTDDQIKLFCKDNPFWIHEFDGFHKRLISRGFDIDSL